MPKLILLVLLVSSFSARSQMLYKCASASGDAVVYLFGTCHRLPEKSFRYDPVIDSVMAECETVFTEMYSNDGSPNYANELQLLRNATHYEPGKGLDSVLTAGQLKEIYLYFKKYLGVSRSFFDRSLTLFPYFMIGRLSYKSHDYISTDAVLVAHAKKLEKPLCNLDNREQLVETYRCLGRIYDANWLLTYVKRDGYTEDMYAEEVYLKGDTTAMLKIISRQSEEENSTVLVNRNLTWQHLLATKPGRRHFVICGIAHLLLPGEGLLHYYRNKGYKVTAIPLRMLKSA
jgi:uncharacterized protein YbaP (TraB family)